MTTEQSLVVQPPMDRDRGSQALLRVLLEASAQAFPLTAALATLYQYTHPTRMEADLRRFHEEVAQKLTDHDQILNELRSFLALRSPVLGDSATDLIVDLLRADTDGRGRMLKLADIATVTIDRGERHYEDAAGELSVLGYVKITPAIGNAVMGASLQLSAYMAFDKAALGHDTQADAVEIAAILQRRDDLAVTRRLQEHLGWGIRRLNPALAALLEQLPGCIKSREACERVTAQIIIGPDERFRLKRISLANRLDS